MPFDDTNLMNRRVAISVYRLERLQARAGIAHALLNDTPSDPSIRALGSDLEQLRSEVQGLLHDLMEINAGCH